MGIQRAKRRLALCSTVVIFCCAVSSMVGRASAAAEPAHPTAHLQGASVYAPYEFLVGEWEVSTEGGGAQAVTRFTWGPGRSYLLMKTSLLVNGQESPHFEGMLMWNGVTKRLDMLLALDLNGGRVQEQGSMFVDANGVIVRDITAHYSEGVRTLADNRVVGPEGATAKFRQTFQRVEDGVIRTTLMRQTSEGWVPTFPGSDKSVMRRR